MFFNSTALKNRLVDGERAIATMRENRSRAYFAFGLYGMLAIAGFWFPLVSATITTATWTFWLLLSIRLKNPARG